MSKLNVPIVIDDQQYSLELDTANAGSLISVSVWKQIGKPKLRDVNHRCGSASKHKLPALGSFTERTRQ